MRNFRCPFCGGAARFPLVWALGVETVFPCPECGRKFKTGYKAGAALFALSLTLALVAANLCVWLFSSVTLPVFILIIIPLWLLFGFLSRRWYLLRKYRRQNLRQRSKQF